MARRRWARNAMGVLLAGALLPDPGRAQSTEWLQYTDPADAGFSVAGLNRAREVAMAVSSGAVMVAVGGHVVAAWGPIDQRWKVYSVRKSLLSLLYGPWVERGAIDLQASLGTFPLPEGLDLTEEEAGATVEAVLSARSGVYLPAARETESAEARRPGRGEHLPDTFWYYNNWDFNVAGWLFEEATGTPIAEAFTHQLAEPLGFEDWRPSDFFWQREPRRTPIPAYGFRLSTRDLARVGQLVVRSGRLDGEAIVSEAWIERSTTPRSELNAGAGYGLMWWIDGKGWLARHLETPVMDRVRDVAAVGAQGQLVLVVPEWDLVIVHRGDTDHGRSVSDPDMLAVAEAILQARTGAPVSEPRLESVAPVPFPYDEPPLELPRWTPVPDEVKAEWVGEYHSPGPPFEVFRWKDGLFIATPGQSDVELFQVGDQLVAEALPLRLTAIERDASGRVERCTLQMPDGRELPLQRAPGGGA